MNEVFAGLARSGRTVAVLSDYPPERKMEAMGLAAEMYSRGGPSGHLKPHPSGLFDLMARAGARANETLVVGDRLDRDGAIADRVGAWIALRSPRPCGGRTTFRDFHDGLFESVVEPRS